MKHATAGKVVLTAAAIGAAIMLIVSVTKDTGEVSAASGPPPAPATASPSPSSALAPSLATQSTSTTAPPPPISAAESEELATEVGQAVHRDISSAKVGMEVYDRQSKTVLTSLNASQTFASMSVVKLLIAVDLLARDDGTMPESATQSLITRMLSASDDSIASSLWVQDGETAIITRDVQLMGLTDTKPPATPGEWGDTKITARDMVTVYDYVMDQLAPDARNLIYNAMYNASEDAADGTNQYFGIPQGLPGTTWAIKQGWGTSGSSAVYNTTGLIDKDSRYVVIVLTSAPLGDYSSLGKALTAGTAQLAPIFKA
jgi:hypothetical protein